MANSVNGSDTDSVAKDLDANGLEKVLYDQEDVFVHTAVPASTYYDNIIRGHVRIIEKPNGISFLFSPSHTTMSAVFQVLQMKITSQPEFDNRLEVTITATRQEDGAYIDWRPADELPPDLDFEVQSYLSGKFEWDVVTTQPSPQDHTSNTEKQEPLVFQEDNRYRIHFKVDRLHSIRRSDPKLAWAYVVFILKDGTTQPALHFHSGGITKMIQTLQRFIWLTKTPTNPKLYIVQATDKALEKSLDQLQLFDEQAGDFFSKIINNAYYGTLSSFSKVTRHVLGGLAQQNGLEEHRPRSTSPGRQAQREHEQFEFINDREIDFERHAVAIMEFPD